MLTVRPVRTDDLDDLLALAEGLDSVNLPHERDALARLVDTSVAAFAGDHARTGPGTFVFVAQLPSGRVVGTASIIASHGTVEDPHHYLRRDVDERYSATLGCLFRHPTLRFRRSYTPHTELAGFIVEPAHRRGALRVGRAVGLGRLLYVALHRARFHDTVQAELLPPLEPDGSSRLWEWIGRRFTGLGYLEADRLSRTNREFISALFPSDLIYEALLPDAVREVIGAVGPGTAPVARLLGEVGFVPNGHVDPFDGGPHLEARTDEIAVTRELRRVPVRLAAAAAPGAPTALVATLAPGAAFRAIPVSAPTAATVELDAEQARSLDVSDGDEVAVWDWRRPAAVEP